jgi:hypothetical protein
LSCSRSLFSSVKLSKTPRIPRSHPRSIDRALAAKEGSDMSSERFDATVRTLASSLTRRASLGFLLAAAAATLPDDEGEARKFKDPRTTRQNKQDRSRRGKDKRAMDEKGAKKKKRKNKDKDNKSSKDKSSGSGGSNGSCTVQHTEKEILGFIQAAARKYGQNAKDMERVARCESVLDPCAVNRSGPYYGLFQFLKSTWRTTPYGNESIWDPEAQSLATAWMWKEGRKNEWACK